MIDFNDYVSRKNTFSLKTIYRLSHFFKSNKNCQKLARKANGIKVTNREQISNRN